MIDDEIAKERHRWKNDKSIKSPVIAAKDEEKWAAILLQGKAALLKSPFELTLTRLTRLKLQKPTQFMEEEAVAVFLEDICDHFDKRGFSYHAIDEGINRLIEREEDKFFPTMRTLISYIHPIHWALKSRIDMIEDLLKRNFN